MKEQFVTYEIAIALKELGFDEPYLAYYRGWIEIYNESTNSYEKVKELQITTDVSGWNTEVIQAPLWQQAIDWIFKKLEINYPYLRIELYSDGSGEWYHPADEGVESLTIMFDTKEEAVLKTIELIKNGST